THTGSATRISPLNHLCYVQNDRASARRANRHYLRAGHAVHFHPRRERSSPPPVDHRRDEMAVHAISQRHVDGLAGADDQPVARTFDGVQPAAPGPVHVAQSRDPKHVEYPWMALSEWTFGCPVR